MYCKYNAVLRGFAKFALVDHLRGNKYATTIHCIGQFTLFGHIPV